MQFYIRWRHALLGNGSRARGLPSVAGPYERRVEVAIRRVSAVPDHGSSTVRVLFLLRHFYDRVLLRPRDCVVVRRYTCGVALAGAGVVGSPRNVQRTAACVPAAFGCCRRIAPDIVPAVSRPRAERMRCRVYTNPATSAAKRAALSKQRVVRAPAFEQFRRFYERGAEDACGGRAAWPTRNNDGINTARASA